MEKSELEFNNLNVDQQEFRGMLGQRDSSIVNGDDDTIVDSLLLTERNIVQLASWSTFVLESNHKSTAVHEQIGVDSKLANLTLIEYYVNFHATEKFTALHQTHLRINLPAITVKEEYVDRIRVKWAKNLAHNLIIKADLRSENRGIIHTLDNYVLDVYRQYYIEQADLVKYERSIGNIPDLQDWSNYLPAYVLNPLQFWFFSQKKNPQHPLGASGNSLKIRTGNPDKYSFHYIFRDRILSLLQMQEWRDDQWVNISPDVKYLEGIETKSKLDPPIMEGKYSRHSEEENNWVKDRLKTHGKTYKDFYVDFQVLVSDDLVKMSSSYTRTIAPGTRPAFAFHVLAYHENCGRINDYSNYTTLPGQVGHNPVQVLKIQYAQQDRSFLVADHASLEGRCADEFISQPFEIGYNSVCLGYKFSPNYLGQEVNVGDLNTNLNITLGSTDPYKGRLGKLVTENDRYRVVIVVPVLAIIDYSV